MVRCIVECLSDTVEGEFCPSSSSSAAAADGCYYPPPAPGLALICNPAPAHRAGAAAFPRLLDAAGLTHVKIAVTSALLRCGMEEETEDVGLEIFAVTHRGTKLPRVDDVGDGWVDWI